MPEFTGMSARVHELERRVANLIRPGVIAETNYKQARVRVRIGGMMTDWLPWLTHRAGKDTAWWAPETGEQVLVLAPSGELAQGYVLPAIYSQAHPTNSNTAERHITEYQDGAFREYNRAAHALTEFVPGNIYWDADGNVRIRAAKVVVEGCDIEVTGGDVVADGVSLKEHKQTGVVSGKDISGPPEK